MREVEATARQLDYAARNIRVLARAGVHLTRLHTETPPELALAINELADAVGAAGEAMVHSLTDDDAAECAERADAAALEAVRIAAQLFESQPPLPLVMIIGQIRATAIDLLRAVGSDDPVLGRIDEALGLPRPHPDTDADEAGCRCRPRTGIDTGRSAALLDRPSVGRRCHRAGGRRRQRPRQAGDQAGQCQHGQTGDPVQAEDDLAGRAAVGPVAESTGQGSQQHLDGGQSRGQDRQPDEPSWQPGQRRDGGHHQRQGEDHVPERVVRPVGAPVGIGAEPAGRGEVELRHDDQYEQDRQSGKRLTHGMLLAPSGVFGDPTSQPRGT
ncbi:hypothetical protein GCM10027605_34610 [Micromonospora zhanjiangensis]